MFYKDEKLAIIIDGPNAFSAFKALEIEVDYKAFRNEFARRGKLVRASYFTVMWESEDHTPMKPLADWLDYNGFNVVTKQSKEFVDSEGKRRNKGTMEVEIAIHALKMAKYVDHIVLFSGNGDYTPLVHELQEMGVKVSVASTLKTEYPMIADDLRKKADNFIEVAQLSEIISR